MRSEMNILDVVEKVYNTVNCADHDEWMEELNITIKQRPLECAMTLLEFAGWQPMETAPRDGQKVLIDEQDGALIASWNDIENQWWGDIDGVFIDSELKGWLPLPKIDKGERK